MYRMGRQGDFWGAPGTGGSKSRLEFLSSFLCGWRFGMAEYNFVQLDTLA